MHGPSRFFPPSGSVRRLAHLGVALAITLAALVAIRVFVVSVRAAPPPAPLAQDDVILRTAGDDTDEDFFEGSFYRTGVARRSPAEGGDGDGDVSLLSVGIAGEWEVDQTTNLPDIDSHTVEIYKDSNGEEHVYVIGGRHGGQFERQTEIYSATIQPGAGTDGEDILGPFSLLTNLPDGRSRHESVIVGDYLYVLGGESETDGGVITETVLYAPIDPATGDIGTFQWASDGIVADTGSPAFCDDSGLVTAQGRSQMGATVVSDTIYVIGGQQPGRLGGTYCVFYATPESNGDILSWQQTSADYAGGAEEVYGNTAVSYNDTWLYSTGGEDDGSPSVYSAQPATDTGDVDSWTAQSNSQLGYRRSAAAVLYNGQILLLGGSTEDGSSVFSNAFVNFVNLDGSIQGQWLNNKPLTSSVYHHDAVVSSRGWVYVIGGIDDSQTPRDDVVYGTLVGDSSQYVPYGEYVSDEIVLDPGNPVRELRWVVHAEDHTLVTTTVDYRMSDSLGQLGNRPWEVTTPTLETNGVQTLTHSFDPPTSTTFFQYRIRMGTQQTDTTPVVQKVEVVYEVEPPDLQVDKISSVGAVGRGELLTYTIESWNEALQADADADNVVLTETMPSYLDIESATALDFGGPVDFAFVDTITRTETATVEKEDNTTEQISVTREYKRYRTSIGDDFLPGTTRTVQLVTRVTDTLAALPLNEVEPFISNTVRIGYDGPDADENNNVAFATNDLALPNLDLAKTVDPGVGDVSPGQELLYTLSIHNDSKYTATNVIVTDLVPTNTTYVDGSVSPSPPGEYLPDTEPRPTVRWNLGTLAPGSNTDVTFKVTVNTDLETLAQVSNVGEVVSDDTLPEQSNAAVNTVATNPDMAISKHVSPETAEAGDTLTYQIRYTNTGDVGLNSVAITDTIPEHTEYVAGSATGGGTYDADAQLLEWSLGTVPLGSNGSLSFQVAITRPLPAGVASIGNRAWARTVTKDPFSSTLTVATISSRPDLRITKKATPAYGIVPNDLITFTLSYTNVGDIGAAGYVITDRVPANTTVVDAGGASVSAGTLTWTPGAELVGLGGHGQQTFVVRVDSLGDGGIANDSYGIATAGGDVTMGAPLYVSSGPDLAALRVTANQTVFRPQDSDSLVISVDVTNQGASFADQAGGVWVDLYVKNADDPPNDATELSNVNTYWYVSDGSIADGTVVRLKSKNDPDHLMGDPYLPAGQQLSSGTYYVYAQINTDDGSGIYPVDEWPRTNNVVGPLVLTVDETMQSPPPSITGVDPDEKEAADNIDLDILGANFQNGAQVSLRRGSDTRNGYDVQRVSSSSLEATFDMAGQLAGTWDVVVVNPDGGTAVLADGFTLLAGSNPPPPPPPCPPDCAIYLPATIRQ